MRKMRESMETGIAAFRMAVERGVRITYSTDSGVYPHELVGRQFDTYVRFGMAPLEAIRSATVVGGRVPGLGGPGRDAGAGPVRGPRRGGR